MTTRVDRLVILALATAFVGWNFGSTIGTAFGVDCTYDCSQLTICTGTTISCPACDLGLQDSCSNWTETTYPNTVFGRFDGGDRDAQLQGEVTCFQITTCGNAGTNWFQVCIGTASGSCQLTPAVFQYCTVCGPVGNVSNNTTKHYVCIGCDA